MPSPIERPWQVEPAQVATPMCARRTSPEDCALMGDGAIAAAATSALAAIATQPASAHLAARGSERTARSSPANLVADSVIPGTAPSLPAGRPTRA